MKLTDERLRQIAEQANPGRDSWVGQREAWHMAKELLRLRAEAAE